MSLQCITSETSISNSFIATKILVNSTTEHVDNFTNRYIFPTHDQVLSRMIIHY